MNPLTNPKLYLERLRQKRALDGLKREFFKDIRLLEGRLLGDPGGADQGVRYVLTKELEPFKQQIRAYLEKLLDNKDLVRKFPDTAAHAQAVSGLRNRIASVLEFEYLERW